jgi:C4-dicarboxylate transporter DctM subunit
VPGILLTLLFIATIAFVTWRTPALSPQIEMRASLAERLTVVREVWAVALLFLLVIGGMYGQRLHCN